MVGREGLICVWFSMVWYGEVFRGASSWNRILLLL